MPPNLFFLFKAVAEQPVLETPIPPSCLLIILHISGPKSSVKGRDSWDGYKNKTQMYTIYKNCTLNIKAQTV